MPETRTDAPETLLKDLKGVELVPGADANGMGLRFESLDQRPQPLHGDALRSYKVALPVDGRTPAQRADAEHATTAGGSGYEVVVGGEYVAMNPTGKGKVRKPYQLPFRVPKLDGALQLIVSKLLMVALQRFYPDAVGYRTHNVVSTRPLSADAPPPDDLRYMNREQLVAVARMGKAPVDLDAYATVEELREALIDWQLNPAGFEKREVERQKERAEMRELLALNPQLAPSAAPAIPEPAVQDPLFG